MKYKNLNWTVHLEPIYEPFIKGHLVKGDKF